MSAILYRWSFFRNVETLLAFGNIYFKFQSNTFPLLRRFRYFSGLWKQYCDGQDGVAGYENELQNIIFLSYSPILCRSTVDKTREKIQIKKENLSVILS